MIIDQSQLYRYYFRAEVADKLGVHVNTITRWVRTGYLLPDQILRGKKYWAVFPRVVINRIAKQRLLKKQDIER